MKFDADEVAGAEGWHPCYGRWMPLLSRAPFIGDPLTVAAGILRGPFPVFLTLVAVAKIARYLAVGALTLDS